MKFDLKGHLGHFKVFLKLTLAFCMFYSNFIIYYLLYYSQSNVILKVTFMSINQLFLVF